MHPGKPWAVVHDFLALPPAEVVRRERNPSFGKLVSRELGRAQAFGRHAQNITGVDGLHADLARFSEAFWPQSASKPLLFDNPGEYVVAESTPRGKLW